MKMKENKLSPLFLKPEKVKEQGAGNEVLACLIHKHFSLAPILRERPNIESVRNVCKVRPL